MTKDDFIERARGVHGTKYDYSKVEYDGNKKNVIIICKKHGEFPQSPNSHLKGFGCSHCSGKAPLTTESFIERARDVHGTKYNYSKVEYVGSKDKVIIICKKHGEFPQSPNSHLKGSGCPHCGGKVQLTTESFIERARDVHGTKYDYSKVKYVCIMDKVTIICLEHGEFTQQAKSHLQGFGCSHCSGKAPLTTKTFIQRAIEKHGYGTYDYSKVKYVRIMDKVTIICPEHGEFTQAPINHLHQGQGCRTCGGSAPLTTETFTQRAIEIHGTKYDYTKVEYVRAHDNIIIICKKHGDFKQIAYSHLQGSGCPHCKADVSQYLSFLRMMKDTDGLDINLDTGAHIVYLKDLEIDGLHFTKIGITRHKRTFPPHVTEHSNRDIATLPTRAHALLLEYLNQRHSEEFNMLPVFNENDIQFMGRSECFSEIKGVFKKITKARILKYVDPKYQPQILDKLSHS